MSFPNPHLQHQERWPKHSILWQDTALHARQLFILPNNSAHQPAPTGWAGDENQMASTRRFRPDLHLATLSNQAVPTSRTNPLVSETTILIPPAGSVNRSPGVIYLKNFLHKGMLDAHFERNSSL
jgi:hypothetical protein